MRTEDKGSDGVILDHIHEGRHWIQNINSANPQISFIVKVGKSVISSLS